MDLCVKGGQATEKILVTNYPSSSLQMQISSGRDLSRVCDTWKCGGFEFFLFHLVKPPKLTNQLHRTKFTNK